MTKGRALTFIAVVGCLVLASIVVYFAIRQTDPAEHALNEPRRSTRNSEVVPRERGRESTDAGVDTGNALSRRSIRRLESPEERSTLIRAIEEARERRLDARDGPNGSSRTRAPEGDSSAEQIRELGPEYTDETIQELVPLFVECYQLAMEEDRTLPEQVELSARLTIVGERDVGGFVEDSTIENLDGRDTNTTFDECMTETLLSMEFPPPQWGGRGQVTYRMVFRTNSVSRDGGPGKDGAPVL